ncbi:hypothetical protein Athai_10540 [Actinocatenispora thailandica]|uniref:Uncharacterized protein n=1 Tax=Actinocatenispora thailandica TaxID=227318 RepID=A0A7R7DL34_9ACTN|nr:hypothetical protein Athai_10540 [Actinocatenispora thailandica]
MGARFAEQRLAVRLEGGSSSYPAGRRERWGRGVCLPAAPRPRPIVSLEARPMELFHATLTALRRLRTRIGAWRDEIAARPIDPNGWWR